MESNYWYEVSICDLVVCDSEEPTSLRITVESISPEDAEGLDGKPAETVSFVGDDVFVVVRAWNPIQALLRAIGLLTPERRNSREDCYV